MAPYLVGIVFENGVKATFLAEEFKIDASFEGLGPEGHTSVNRFQYTDQSGNPAPLYLTPSEVAGIAVVPVGGESVPLKLD